MNRAKWVYLLAACLLSLSLGVGTWAQDQSSSRGNLSGVVLDASKATVPGAQITITGPIGNLSQTTNDQGTFLFSTLIPGFYSIRVQKAGFKVANVAATEVLINKTTSVEVVLETGEVTQTVEVSAATVTVDTSAASVNSEFSDTFYSKIPLGRGVSSLFYLAPGVTSGLGTGVENPSISGSSGLENLYVADGVSINDPAFGGIGVWSRVYGPLGTGINLSFVKEVQIKTGGFEPQYGHVSGGIVQLVTKSGGTKFFGTVGGYFNSRWMQDTYQNSDDPKFSTVNKVGSRLENADYEGDFELGGYVPLHGLRDRLFFFGTFNPSQNHAYFAPAAGSGLATISPTVDRKTIRYDYAAKLTFKINNSHSIESSVSGDPSHTDPAAFSTLNTDNTSANSKWDYGTRQWATRYDGAFGNSVLVDAAFTWGWNHFTETPATNVYQIADNTQIAGLPGQRGAFNAQGIGVLEPYEANTKGLTGDVTKTFHFAGTHSINVGYTWQYPHYNEHQFWSGPKYEIPATNATAATCSPQPACGSPGYGPNVAGQMTDSAFQLILAGQAAPGADNLFNAATNPNDTACTLCPFMNVPGYASPVRVALQQVRGRFDGGVTKSTGKYHAAYINDAWQINKYVTLNAGVRWEQQRLTGNQVERTFTDMFSPRAGIIVDPQGNRKQKIYANFGRYAYVLPLDAAIRALSNEEDFQNSYWAPANAPCTVSGATNPTCVTLNSLGSTDFVPNSANLLNLANGGIPIAAGALVTGGEPFAPGTRMEFTDEFLVGYDREFKGGVVASVRYIDRRLKRVIEDQGGISVEEFNALASNGGGLNYSIGNPNAKQDVFINPNEIVFSQGTPFNIPTDGAGNPLPLTPANETAYLNAGMPAACFDSFGFGTPFIAYNQSNGFNAANGGAVSGSACFPAVNTNAWTDASGNLLPNAVNDQAKCAPAGAKGPVAGCAYFGGEFIPDGKPDTYKDPKREYEAVEFEVRKAFTHNWALSVNYRVAQLRGNYEGAFRNDNGQADPGISSLFDFTEGALGLLANQQSIGSLSTDRKHVLNAHSTFVVPNGKLKGFVIGGGLSVLSGNPLSTLVAQQAYVQPGEVPIFGRGDLGRSPVTGSVDAHLEYPFHITERMQLKVAFDLFNIVDSTRNTTVQQFYDVNFGLKNLDFGKPTTNNGLAYPASFTNQGFVNPFSSRLSVLLTF
ncbi:MAG TPA: TonB-dependent receptor [Candidatus Baltobacteraceae bacterium]|nr:TonB-dependent receptor [Candidatus Baltobacteraceae bacterium]